MKKIIPFFMFLSSLTVMANDITLPAHDSNKGLNVMQTFAQRRSTREFDTKELSLQDLSNVLWATTGINRRDENKLTAPSCLNKQEIRLFVLMAKGAYEYIPATHTLRHIADGDYRQSAASGQKFVEDAPVTLIMVADMEKFGSSDQRSMTMAAIDAGIVSENACIAASGLGLATVPRATMDTDRLRKVLGLTEKQIPLMNNPIGYFKK